MQHKLLVGHDEDRRVAWEAHWIQHHVQGKGPHYTFFRKEFVVTGKVRKATLHITADRYYKLHLGKRFIGEGPVRGSGHYWSFDTYDVKALLDGTGEHVLAVVVSQWDPDRANPPALLAQLEIAYMNGESATVTTGPDWEAYQAAGWRSDAPFVVWTGKIPAGYVEIRDMRPDDMNWMDAGFRDRRFAPVALFHRFISNSPVRSIGEKWSRLIPRDIPQLESRRVRPEAVVQCGEVEGSEITWGKALVGSHLWVGLEHVLPLEHASVLGADRFTRGEPIIMRIKYIGDYFGRIVRQPAVIFDFGRMFNGYIQLDVSAGSGDTLDLTYSQTLLDGKVHPYTGGIHRAARYILKEGRQIVESFEYVNCRYLQITFADGNGPVVLHNVALRAIEYPAEPRSAFECSDDLLNRIWSASENTLRLCMTDIFVDNTWREKTGWGGDVTVAMLSALACYGDLALIRRYLRMFVLEQLPSGMFPIVVPGGGGTIFDHAMAIPLRYRDYYEFTGDLAFLEGAYPSLFKYMTFLEHLETDDGLIDEFPGAIWFDWAVIDRRPLSVTLNFYYMLVLQAMECIAEAVGQGRDAEVFRAKRERIRAKAEMFWDEEREVFPDSFAGGTLSENVSENTNALAILCGAADDPDRRRALLNNAFGESFGIHAEKKVKKSGPPFAYYVLEALSQAGAHEKMLDYLRERQGSAFAQGLDTMPETWMFSPRGEVSAAQGTVPASWVLQREVLGVKPLAAGFAKVLVAPRPGGLTWARGRCATPAGEVEVSWNAEAGTFTVEIETEPNVEVVVRLPVEGEASGSERILSTGRKRIERTISMARKS